MRVPVTDFSPVSRKSGANSMGRLGQGSSLQLLPLHAEVVKDALAFSAFLIGDAGVGMAEHHPPHTAAHQGAAADETGFMRDIRRRHRTVAEAQGVLLRMAGV